ncbi:MAG: TlpA disulfide reductase family protein [Xanthobacteraceae bacterium]
MTKPEEPTQTRARKRLAMVVAGGVAGVAVGLAAVYGIKTMERNAPAAACGQAAELTRRLAPLAHGEVAAFAVADPSRPIPDLAFRDASGNERHLADWRGRTVLLNLWATWCVPCRKEMPALAALEKKLGGPRFEVVAVNIDTRDPDKPRAWLKEVGIDRLGYYADPTAKVFQDLKIMGLATGMPTTLLVDSAGCEIGTVAGPAEWASDDAIKLVTAALQK